MLFIEEIGVCDLLVSLSKGDGVSLRKYWASFPVGVNSSKPLTRNLLERTIRRLATFLYSKQFDKGKETV